MVRMARMVRMVRSLADRTFQLRQKPRRRPRREGLRRDRVVAPEVHDGEARLEVREELDPGGPPFELLAGTWLRSEVNNSQY